MRLGMRRVLSWVAIYAIALHAILSGVAPLLAAPAVDPFSVICHSEPADQAPATPTPARACDHCTLCSALAPPQPDADVVTARLKPPVLLEVLRPAVAVTPDGFASALQRARGPPSVA
jgi:hypothetical protein